MNDKASCHPSDVINYMKINYGVNVSYDKAWRGREIELNFIRSTLKVSYAMLPDFLDALIRSNPCIICYKYNVIEIISIGHHGNTL